MKFKDVTGQSFGRLKAINYVGKRYGMSQWRCICACGNRSVVAINNLSNGHTKSCGCLSREITIARSTTHGEAPRSGDRKEHRVWGGMHCRCDNKNDRKYPVYGGAGIKVCRRWCGRNGYANFLKDMGRCPAGKRSIDRINGKKGYYPDNCRWADNFEQANNQKTNRPIRFHGITLNLCQWARRVGLSHCTLHMRLKQGWSISRALTEPINIRCRKRASNHTIACGRSGTVKAWLASRGYAIEEVQAELFA